MNCSSNNAPGVRGRGARPKLVRAAVATACVGAGSALFVVVAGARPDAASQQLACARTASQQTPPDAGGAASRGDGGAPRDNSADRERQNRGGPSAGSFGGSPFDFGFGYGHGQSRGDLRAPRPREWEETQAFMSRYAPRRQAALDQMPEGEKKEGMKKFVFARFRGLQSLQRRDPAAYEQRLGQLTIEDQIFGLVSDWTGAGEAAKGQLLEALRNPVSRLVDLDLQERQRRIDWLRRELADQTEALERDQKDRDNIVSRRVQRFADWAGRWAERRKQGSASGDAVAGPQASPDKSVRQPDSSRTPLPDANHR